MLASALSVTRLSAEIAHAHVVIDPTVRALAALGRTRVLVELRAGEAADTSRRPEAIARAQDALMSHLPAGHAAVTRRYTSIPMLALEIDDVALRMLESVPDLVVAVKPDRVATPQ